MARSPSRALLVLCTLLVAGCPASGLGGLPDPQIESAERLRRAVMAALPTSIDQLTGMVDIAKLKADGGVQLALSSYESEFRDPASAQVGYMRAWSERRIAEPELTAEEELAGTLPHLLLPAADFTALSTLIDKHEAEIFVFDPPRHKPDPASLALLFREHPDALITRIGDAASIDFPEVKAAACDQAFAMLVAAASASTTVPVALRLSSGDTTARPIGASKGTWLRVLKELLAADLAASEAAQLPAIYHASWSRPFDPANDGQLRDLLLMVKEFSELASHPSIIATARTWIAGLTLQVQQDPTLTDAARQLTGVIREAYPMPLTPHTEADLRTMQEELIALERLVGEWTPTPDLPETPPPGH